jgi:hypothetical protein
MVYEESVEDGTANPEEGEKKPMTHMNDGSVNDGKEGENWPHACLMSH